MYLYKTKLLITEHPEQCMWKELRWVSSETFAKWQILWQSRLSQDIKHTSCGSDLKPFNAHTPVTTTKASPFGW